MANACFQLHPSRNLIHEKAADGVATAATRESWYGWLGGDHLPHLSVHQRPPALDVPAGSHTLVPELFPNAVGLSSEMRGISGRLGAPRHLRRARRNQYA